MAEDASFRDKVVVITGAAGGIGTALCQRFGRDGARIFAVDCDGAAVLALAEKLRASGFAAMAQTCDVTDPEQCRAAIDGALAAFGGIDVLINNAGITHRSAFLTTRPDVFRRVVDVNLFGSLYCTQAALPSLLTRRGQIVVISSVAGLAPLLGRTGYAASKHALHGLFGSLRTELIDSGVDVTIVCPSFTDTNIARQALDGDGSLTTHPQSTLGKLAQPIDVADGIYRAALRRRRLVVLTPLGKLAHLVATFLPAYYERSMARRLRAELQR